MKVQRSDQIILNKPGLINMGSTFYGGRVRASQKKARPNRLVLEASTLGEDGAAAKAAGVLRSHGCGCQKIGTPNGTRSVHGKKG